MNGDMIIRVRSVLFSTALAAAVACGDGPTQPEAAAGSLSFTYSGAQSGTLTVTGALNPRAGPPSSDGAVAWTDREDGVTVITGVRTRGTTNADMIQIALPRVTTPRTFTLNAGCAPALTVLACPLAIIGIDVPIQAPQPGTALREPPAGLYLFTAGTIVVTSVSGTRVTGTFQGSAETLGFEPLVPSKVIAVTNGTFDVPILSDPRR